MSEIPTPPIQVAGLRDTVRDITIETIKIFRDLRQVVRNFNIRTKPARDELVKTLNKYYERNIPKSVKNRIMEAIDFLNDVKDDTVEGVRDGIDDYKAEELERELQNIFNPFYKQKSEMEEFQEKFEDEIDRVTEKTHEWEETNQDLARNPDNSMRL